MEREASAERPRTEYERRLTDRHRRTGELERRHLHLSNLRLVLAAAGAVLLWLAFARARLSPWWAVLVWAVFAGVAVFHAKLLQRIDRSRRAERLYTRALERVAGRWAGTGRDGAAFAAGHPYARDLDLFGRASLFELLNTARTEAGESTLATWLKEGADLDEVAVRQAAVDELRPNLDFREDLSVLAAEGDVSRTGALARWAADVSAAIPPIWPVAFGACAVVTALLVALASFDRISWAYVIAWLAVEGIVALLWKRSLQAIAHEVGKPADDLRILLALARCVDRQTFASPRLAGIRTALDGAAAAIGRLERLVSLLDSSTHNLFAMPITRALLVPEQLALAIERWRQHHGHAVQRWLAAFGDVEAIAAIATYAYEHPDDPFPSFATDAAADAVRFDAEALRHPLLPADTAVANDVALGAGGPQVLVVSGSNMSGKSTLLRAVGVNVVLALAGAPVAARRIALSRVVIGATLRVDDSLEEGHSKFYNEILRLRAIVDAARGPVPLLFLLDEILHGTNSYDRRIGAEAVIRALVAAGAIGIVTTHDLALAELPSTLGAAANAHFEDRLENGRMVFDYRMRPGVVEHSNALALMRAIGLDV